MRAPFPFTGRSVTRSRPSGADPRSCHRIVPPRARCSRSRVSARCSVTARTGCGHQRRRSDWT
eukprot:5743850-Alexandrium_andersonii.AAC.1